jgi:hypothetical protein
MAMDEILATVDAKLQDPTTGLAAKTAARAAALGMTSGPKGRIRTDFFFESWLTSGKVRPATVPQIGVRPRSWRPREKLFVNSPRLADAQLEVVLEVVAADQAVIEDNAAVIAAALMQCLDELEPGRAPTRGRSRTTAIRPTSPSAPSTGRRRAAGSAPCSTSSRNPSHDHRDD